MQFEKHFSLCALVACLGVVAGQMREFNSSATYAKAAEKGVELMVSKMASISEDSKMVHFMLSMLHEVKSDGTMVSETSHVNVSGLTLTSTEGTMVMHDHVNMTRVTFTATNFYSGAGTLLMTYNIVHDKGHYSHNGVYNLSVMAGDVVVTMNVHDWNFDSTGAFLDAKMMIKGSADDPMMDDDASTDKLMVYTLGDTAMLKLPKMVAKGDPWVSQDLTDEHFMKNETHFTVRMPKDAKLSYAFIICPSSESDTGAAAQVNACAVIVLALAALQKFLF